MLFSLMMLLITPALGENCDDISCANVFDEVCGMADLKDGNQIIMQYQNVCHMRKEACELEPIMQIYQVADELCNIEKPKIELDDYLEDGRRVSDYSIVGAHQACNHSCPTYCTDAYEPACAQIWKSNMLRSTLRPMINHCHIDLFSCTLGINVTVQPLVKCYKNGSGLLFMQQIAAMKSLKLLDDDPLDVASRSRSRRRTNNDIQFYQTADDVTFNKDAILKEQLQEVVKRIFDKYRDENDIF